MLCFLRCITRHRTDKMSGEHTAFFYGTSLDERLLYCLFALTHTLA